MPSAARFQLPAAGAGHPHDHGGSLHRGVRPQPSHLLRAPEGGRCTHMPKLSVLGAPSCARLGATRASAAPADLRSLLCHNLPHPCRPLLACCHGLPHRCRPPPAPHSCTRCSCSRCWWWRSTRWACGACCWRCHSRCSRSTTCCGEGRLAWQFPSAEVAWAGHWWRRPFLPLPAVTPGNVLQCEAGCSEGACTRAMALQAEKAAWAGRGRLPEPRLGLDSPTTPRLSDPYTCWRCFLPQVSRVQCDGRGFQGAGKRDCLHRPAARRRRGLSREAAPIVGGRPRRPLNQPGAQPGQPAAAPRPRSWNPSRATLSASGLCSQ